MVFTFRPTPSLHHALPIFVHARDGDARLCGHRLHARAVVALHREEARRRGQEASAGGRSEEHTSELQSLMRISYAVFCLKKQKTYTLHRSNPTTTQVDYETPNQH